MLSTTINIHFVPLLLPPSFLLPDPLLLEGFLQFLHIGKSLLDPPQRSGLLVRPNMGSICSSMTFALIAGEDLEQLREFSGARLGFPSSFLDSMLVLLLLDVLHDQIPLVGGAGLLRRILVSEQPQQLQSALAELPFRVLLVVENVGIMHPNIFTNVLNFLHLLGSLHESLDLREFGNVGTTGELHELLRHGVNARLLLESVSISSGAPDLLAIPMKLVDDEGTGDSHACAGASSTLQLVDVLVHHLQELLMQVVVCMSVLEEKGEHGAFWVELIVSLVDQHRHRSFKMLGQ